MNLHFIYGTVSSYKKDTLIYSISLSKNSGKKTFLIKPQINNDNNNLLKNKCGNISVTVDLIIKNDDNIINIYMLSEWYYNPLNIIYVSSCHLLTVEQINQLRELVDNYGITVICFGLKTKHDSVLYKSSKRLCEIADIIEELPSICVQCNTYKAILNKKKIINDKEHYMAVCSHCYNNDNSNLVE